MKAFVNLFERSILVRLGFVFGLIILLGLTSMLSAMIIAETTKGEAAAINLVGSLRMQSYRTASLLLDPAGLSVDAQATAVVAAMDKLEATLLSPKLIHALPADSSDPRHIGYEQILTTWQKAMRPLFSAHLKLLRQNRLNSQGMQPAPAPTAKPPQILPSINIFVDHINQFVQLLEEDIEYKNLLLRIIQGAALLLMLGVVLISIYIVQTEVLAPLRGLLMAAERIRSHDFSARVDQAIPNELGRLGEVFNLMAEELSRLYADLEMRVAQKTASLERSNRSLELLYRSIGHLYQKPVAADTYALLLKDFEEMLGCGRGSVCLTREGPPVGTTLAAALMRVQGDAELCDASTCAECFAGGSPRWRVAKAGASKVLALPLRDIEGYYGVLQWEIPGDQELDAWQLQLLEALSTHVGIAIGMAQRGEQRRRYSLHEERAIIARELHDSLAQSLSYMKIQVARLQAVVEQKSAEDSQKVLGELREGLNSAYRQLRELLSTFRLKVEGGLVAALEKTVNEFSSRGNVAIQITTNVDSSQLSPNEEIHLLQIVRESLGNVIHHAHASRAQVAVSSGADGIVTATIDDNGVGFDFDANSTLPKAHHYGMTIMKERARNLHATLSVQQRAEGGTRVELRFMPNSRKNSLLRQAGGTA